MGRGDLTDVRRRRLKPLSPSPRTCPPSSAKRICQGLGQREYVSRVYPVTGHERRAAKDERPRSWTRRAHIARQRAGRMVIGNFLSCPVPRDPASSYGRRSVRPCALTRASPERASSSESLATAAKSRDIMAWNGRFLQRTGSRRAETPERERGLCQQASPPPIPSTRLRPAR